MGFAGEDEGLPGDGGAEDYAEFFAACFAELAGEQCLLNVDFQPEFLAASRCLVEIRGVLSYEMHGDDVALVFDGFGDE